MHLAGSLSLRLLGYLGQSVAKTWQTLPLLLARATVARQSEITSAPPNSSELP